jgi:hypothetical protein
LADPQAQLFALLDPVFHWFLSSKRAEKRLTAKIAKGKAEVAEKL